MNYNSAEVTKATGFLNKLFNKQKTTSPAPTFPNDSNQQTTPTPQDLAQKKEGKGDALDQGVQMMAKRAGYKVDNKTTEALSDGVRMGFKKIFKRDIPIKDQQMK